MSRNLFYIFFFFLSSFADAQLIYIHDSTFLTKFLKNNNSIFQKKIENPEKFKLQIIYTQVNRNKNKEVLLKNFVYRYRPNEYFYPASAVKLPTALITLEKINQYREKGISIKTPFKVEAACPCFSDLVQDVKSSDSVPRLENYLKKALVVSDNESYNVLFDFAGQRDLNQRLWNLGYPNARILHRFYYCDSLDNSCSNTFSFYDENKKVFFTQESEKCTIKFTPPFQFMSAGEKNKIGDTVYDEPRNFLNSNCMPLEYLHDMLIRIFYPKLYDSDKQFTISDEDRKYLISLLAKRPDQLKIDEYKNKNKYWDAYTNYLYYGWDRKAVLNNKLKIYNIVGLSYGFVVDCAYFIDAANNVEFFLSAVIYTNESEVINDDKYEYSSIAMPFMKELGRGIYKHELQRKKKN